VETEEYDRQGHFPMIILNPEMLAATVALLLIPLSKPVVKALEMD